MCNKKIDRQSPVKRRQIKQRNNHGMLLATTDLMVIIPLFVLAIFVLGDGILLAVFKFKLCQVAALSAAYAVELPPESDVPAKTKAMALQMLKSCSLPAQKVSVATKLKQIGDTELLEISVSGEFELLQGSCLPFKIFLTEQSAAPLPANQVRAVIGITPYPYSQGSVPSNPTVYVPIIRPTNHMPVWSFPFDSSLSYMKVVSGDEPQAPVPTCSSQYLLRPSIY